MAFELLKTKITYLFRTVTALSRSIRTHTKHIKENDERFHTEFLTALKEVSARGDAKGVVSVFTQGENMLEKSELLVFENEAKLQAIADTFESKEHMLLPIFTHEERTFASFHPPKGANEELLESFKKTRQYCQIQLAACEVQVRELQRHMLAEVQKEYQALTVQAHGAEKGEYEHWFVTRAKGLAALKSAMDDDYQLRRDWAKVGTLVSQLEGTVKRIEDLVRHIETADAHMQGKLEAKLCEEMKSIQPIANDLANAIGFAFERFTAIMRVFVRYYFILANDEKELEHFVGILKQELFPQEHLQIITQAHDKAKAHIAQEAEKRVDAQVRLRHVE